jgi:putative transposase
MSNYKRIFLDGYSYYITIVTYERNPILLQHIDLLRESFAYAKTKFDFSLHDIVILPDHFHMIISVSEAKMYPKIISSIKRYFSQRCDASYTKHILQSYSRTKQGYNPIWQKRYYEHTIRDEKDYMEKRIYMYHNPVKHGYTNNVETWRYGSFNR